MDMLENDCEVLPSGWSFKKHLITPGEGELSPHAGSKCRVSLSNIDGTLQCQLCKDFMQSGVITIGDADSDAMETIDICVQTMKEGEISDFVITDNSDPAVTSNLNICMEEFQVTPPFHELTNEEKLTKAAHHKEKGTELFKNGNVEFAFQHYSRALKYLICADSLSDSDITLSVGCYLNLAACQLKYHNYPHVIRNCSKALMMQTDNVKGLYRRAIAYSSLDMLDEAIVDYTAIRQLEPNNKQVQRELTSVVQKRKKQEEKLASRLKGMFD